MRTWKCPQCGHLERISYDWLAERGGPVCEQCDCDMDLQPAANDRAIVVERLVNKADAAGLESEQLDEIVHEFAASVAADADNGGLEDQIKYLVEGIGAQHTERQIDELIEQRLEEK